MPELLLTNDDFAEFCIYLVRRERVTAVELLDVILRPSSHSIRYTEWLVDTGQIESPELRRIYDSSGYREIG